MRDCGFDGDHAATRGINPLTTKLPQIKRRRPASRQQNADPARLYNGTGTHLDVNAAHRSQVTVMILKFKSTIAERQHSDAGHNWLAKSRAELCSDRQFALAADTDTLSDRNCRRVIDDDDRVRNVMLDEGAQEVRRIARSTAADVVSGLDQNDRSLARRDVLKHQRQDIRERRRHDHSLLAMCDRPIDEPI